MNNNFHTCCIWPCPQLGKLFFLGLTCEVILDPTLLAVGFGYSLRGCLQFFLPPSMALNGSQQAQETQHNRGGNVEAFDWWIHGSKRKTAIIHREVLDKRGTHIFCDRSSTRKGSKKQHHHSKCCCCSRQTNACPSSVYTRRISTYYT